METTEHKMAKIRATVFYERKYWVGSFERTDEAGYAVARHIFGGEPTDFEIYEFILQNYTELKFGKLQTFELEVKRMNPKRMQRQIKREMEKLKETSRPSTLAQDTMREELEQNKKEAKKTTRAEREARKEEQFSLKQVKRKEKKRGH